MACRVNFHFQQNSARVGGWTENFYNVEASPDNLVVESTLLANKLIAIHGRETVLTYFSIRQIGTTTKLTRLVRFQTTPNNTATDSNARSDYATTALQITLVSSDGKKTRQWIKGIPDDKVINGGEYSAGNGQPADYANRIRDFFNQLPSGGWRMRVRNNALPDRTMTNFDPLTGKVTLALHGLTDGSYVKMHGVQIPHWANGIWRVAVTDPGFFFIVPWDPPVSQSSLAWNHTGKFQLQSFDFPTINASACEVTRASERKVGRPFGQLSGRRRSKR